MDKQAALALIDEHKNKLINPVEMLDWVWLRVIIINVPPASWDEAVAKTELALS